MLLLLTLAPATAVASVAVSEDWAVDAPAEQAVVPRTARPLPLPHDCHDRRYPALAGPFLVHCGPTGAPDRVLDLSTGRTTTLPPPSTGWARGHGVLYALGRDGGSLLLPEGTASGPSDRVEDARTPPGVGGDLVAYGGEDVLGTFERGERTRTLHDASPLPGRAPAVTEDRIVVWPELRGDDLDLHALVPDARRPVPFATGPGHQDHPVASGRFLAWVDRGDVVVADPIAGRTVRREADTGFEGPPALFDDHVCWGDRTDGLEVRCSDGWSVPGRLPSGGGPLTLVQTVHGPVLHAARWWPVAPDSPRREPRSDGLETLHLEAWWGTGTATVEREGPEGWAPVATVELAAGVAAEVEVSAGVPLRVVPDHPIPRGLR